MPELVNGPFRMGGVAACNNPTQAIAASICTIEGGRHWDAPAPLRLWHVASLDAPTVALVWSCAFAWAVHVRVPAWAPLVLALIAWAMYIGDRLLDARAGMQSPPMHRMRERHHFHWHYRRILLPVALAAAVLAALVIVMRLPARARMPDTALAAATLAYFSGIHSRGRIRPVEWLLSTFSSRAFLIGVLFTAGCLLPAASQVAPAASVPVARVLAWPAVFFAALAWLNCHAIGHWESARSERAPTGIVGKAGLVAATGFALAFLMGGTAPRIGGLVIAGTGSALLLALLERMRTRLTPLALRAAADLVLLTPAILLLFGT